jgi:hypothetical protein
LGESKSSTPSDDQEAISLVRELRSIELPNFRVVGGMEDTNNPQEIR